MVTLFCLTRRSLSLAHQVARAAALHFSLSEEQRADVSSNILAGLHGQAGYTLPAFRAALSAWRG